MWFLLIFVNKKIPRDLTEAWLSGAGLSIVAALVMMFLLGMVLILLYVKFSFRIRISLSPPQHTHLQDFGGCFDRIQNDRIFSDLGPCVRDYIHVLDLADGHIVVLRKLDDPKIDFPLENAYELLGVSETNSFDEIKASFRKLAKETHQDLAESMNDSTASRQFVKILADYEVCANLVLEDLSSH
ncbi:UDP-glucose 4-epimerase GEPI48 [Glycine soja]